MTLRNILRCISILAFSLTSFTLSAQTKLSPGEQPEMTVDNKGTVRLIFGQKDKIFFSTSTDNGRTFGEPQLIAEVKNMHLGHTRGPQIATSKDFSLVTAMDTEGNIHSFVLNHKTGTWQKSQNVNDVIGSAPEGLMSIAADDNNKFFAVWLDIRINKHNNICFSSFENEKWSANKFIYQSPEGIVCSCCKPSVETRGKTLAVMFRNSLKGSRDLYFMTSSNEGKTFGGAEKLGTGTWVLEGCPMDGGGLTINSKNQIQTAWQRDGFVYYSIPGQPEERVGEGRNVSLTNDIVSWQKGKDLVMRKRGSEEQKIGQGSALQLHQLPDNSLLGVWEQEKQIVFSRL
jgi:hypothetical protein